MALRMGASVGRRCRPTDTVTWWQPPFSLGLVAEPWPGAAAWAGAWGCPGPETWQPNPRKGVCSERHAGVLVSWHEVVLQVTFVVSIMGELKEIVTLKDKCCFKGIQWWVSSYLSFFFFWKLHLQDRDLITWGFPLHSVWLNYGLICSIVFLSVYSAHIKFTVKLPLTVLVLCLLIQ